MKKSIFILTALFAATFANAQITLEATFNGQIPVWLSADEQYFDAGKLPIIYGDTLLELYNEDMSLYKQVRFAPSQVINPGMNAPRHMPSATKGGPTSGCFLISQNIFTTDNKIAFIRWSDGTLKVYDEDGTLLKDIGDNNKGWFGIITVNGKYKLIVVEGEWVSDGEYMGHEEYKTQVYSLPGNGEIRTEITTPSSPKRSARKIAREGQVWVETDTNTFDLRGQEVR